MNQGKRTQRAIEVFLIPGFFGFCNLGEFRYFEHVRVVLGDALTRRSVRATIHDVRVPPTASLRERALRVGRAVENDAPRGDVHVVGHSVGGLDARLLVSPGVDLGPGTDVEAVASRIRSIVTVATPHHGTPVARAFQTKNGHQLLQMLSLVTVYIVRERRLPRSAVRLVAELVSQMEDGDGLSSFLLDRATRELMQSFESDQQRQLEAFFSGMAEERGLMSQLTPSAVELLNTTIQERDGVRLGSVVTRSRAPRWMGVAELGLDAYAQSMYALYRWLYGLASLSEDTHVPMPKLTRDTLKAEFGEAPKVRANDGIVPTWCQAWGEVIHAARADHLDIIGHFDAPGGAPPHFDWLPSGTEFDEDQFEAAWDDVAAFIAR